MVEHQLRVVVCQKIEGNGDHAGEAVHVFRMEMETMRVKLFMYSEWKSKIRFSNIGRKVTANYEKLAANYLDARVR
jgi:hypothetical protein